VPTYAYTCTSCTHSMEVKQSFSDPSLIECPECTGRLRKVFNSVGVVFKGSGFYRTDSRSGSGGQGEGKADSGGSGSSGSSDAAGSSASNGSSGGSASSSGTSSTNGATNGAKGASGAKASTGGGSGSTST
jgi:putative FmdB family regulatory protein